MRQVIFYLLGLILLSTNLWSAQKQENALSSETFNGLKFRCIGPAVSSGRIIDFAVNPKNPSEYYVAVASGGVWKTTNAVITFTPIFDQQGSYSIGCVTMDPENHFVIWVGTGENNSQRSVGYGNGIYKSLDGGKSWKNMGLKRSEHIGRILVDPHNSNHVYVAAQGPLWGPGGDRGLYETRDGGKTWKAILTISENTGVSEIIMDPRNPDVLYCSAYQRRRHVWTLIDGGPESAIYKSSDGGSSWEKLTSGLPEGNVGRIGMAISPANPDILYAIIEAAGKNGGFFRSLDRGATWEKRCDYVSGSPQYYQELMADPLNPERVYSMDTFMMVTHDGGRTFLRVGNNGRHVDDHALWIDPQNTDHLLIGGDGGIYESFDRGQNYDFKSNLPITQFYRAAVDNTLPFYYVYGGTQDNNTLGGPSRTTSSTGIVNADWFVTQGGDGFETQIEPTNPDIVYSQAQHGWIVRYDKKSGEAMGIKPQEGKGETPLRWNWDSPLLISPHSPTRLYFAANKLFRSEDRGNTWRTISGDLTRQIDRNKLPVMGKIWSIDAVAKNLSTSYYGNIVALSESPLKEDLLFVGTDDGLIQISENAGNNWCRIEKFPGIPEMTYVSCVLASNYNTNTIYAAFDNHKNADFTPYLLRSTDMGKTWQSIRGNLPDTGSVYSVAEDHVKPELLFAGTESGIFFTVDGGKIWTQLKGEIPIIAIKDIAIQSRENDLVLASFGRSFYILDNYAPLRQISPDLLSKDAYIFPVKNAWMYVESNTGTGVEGSNYYTAPNPPFGATFTYYLKEDIKTLKAQRQEKEKELEKKGGPVPYPRLDSLRAEDEEEAPYIVFTITDESGTVLRKLKTPAKKGLQRITWDLRMPSTSPINLQDRKEGEAVTEESGIWTIPGRYYVSMARSVNGVITDLTGPEKFETITLAMTTLPAADRTLLFTFQKKVAELNRAVQGTIAATKEIQSRIKHIQEAIKNTPGLPIGLIGETDAIYRQTLELMRTLTGDPSILKRGENAPPAIADRVQSIIYDQWQSTSAPTQTQQDAYRIAGEEFKPQLDQLKKLIGTDLKNLENKLELAGAPWTPGRIPEWQMK